MHLKNPAAAFQVLIARFMFFLSRKLIEEIKRAAVGGCELITLLTCIQIKIFFFIYFFFFCRDACVAGVETI